MAWRSWSGAVRADPRHIEQPRSVDELAEVVRRTRARGGVLRPVGSGHSFTPIAACQDTMVLLDRLDTDSIEIAQDQRSVTVPAGMTLHRLNRQLAQADLALPNLGDHDRQTIAGAMATGTHGGAGGFGPLHTHVTAIQLVDGRGQLQWLDDADLTAARLALGALGVVTKLRLTVRPAFRLAMRTTRVPRDDVLTDFPHHVADHRHAEFQWLPHTRWARLRLADLSEEAALPMPAALRMADVLVDSGAWLAGQAARTVAGVAVPVARLRAIAAGDRRLRRPSHDALSTVHLARYQEMEFALPADRLHDAVLGLDRLISAGGFPVTSPVTVRPVAADTSALLSPTWERESVCVAVRTVRGLPYTRYFKAAQALLRELDGRPHWGKIHTLEARDLAQLYPRWDDFQQVRSRLDPDGVFISPYLRRVLGAPPGAG